MSTRKSTPPPSSSMSHTHGEHCEACGHHLLVERRYSINDRFARALFASVCRSMDLVPTAASKRPGAQIVVRAADAATHDRLLARFDALLPLLDHKLVALSADFVHEHLGIDLGAARSSR